MATQNEAYDIATDAEQIKNDIQNAKNDGEIRRISEELREYINTTEPTEAVIVGDEPGWNNADERPRAEIYEIEGHKILKFETAEYSQIHVVDGADLYEMLFESMHNEATAADDYTFNIESVGMIGDAVARDLADEFEHAEYEPLETYLSDQEHSVWVLTRVRGRSYEETANAMGISVETVKTYVSRVSKKKNKARRTLELLD